MSKAILGGSVRQVVFGLGAALLFIVAIEAAQLGMGGFGFLGWDGSSFGWHGASITEKDGKLSVTVRDEGCTLKVKSRGEITVNEAEDEIVAMSRDGHFQLDERGCGPDLELEALPGQQTAGPRVTVKIDGKTAAYDAATRERVHQSLLRVWRWSGWQAKDRLARLEKRGGLEAVLNEAAEIRTDYGQAIYLSHLLARPNLDDATVNRIWRTAAEGISGDYEMSRLVIEADPANLRGRPELKGALATISSDYELGQALEHVLEHASPDEATLRALLEASREISADYEQSQFLQKVAKLQKIGSAPPAELDAALRTISADYEQSQTIQAFLESPGLDRDFIERLIDVAADGISADYELGQVLESLAEHQQRGAEGWPPAVDRAIDSISSRYERDEARQALNRHRDSE